MPTAFEKLCHWLWPPRPEIMAGSLGRLVYKARDKEWFGWVEGIRSEHSIELGIWAADSQQDISQEIRQAEALLADYEAISAELLRWAWRNYAGTPFEKPAAEIERLYFLSGATLVEPDTWWLVLEPTSEAPVMYNHLLRFTMVGREVVWANFPVDDPA